MMSKIVYQTSVTSTGGRDGRAQNDDGSIDITLAVPKEMGGNGNGNNPEQLFAAGYSACFLSAMKFAASQNKEFPRITGDTKVTATVGIGPREDKGFGLSVDLEVHIPDADVAEVQALVDEADTICPYSHAVRGNIPVTVKAV
jgi:osmotically inducible protein OsmC